MCNALFQACLMFRQSSFDGFEQGLGLVPLFRHDVAAGFGLVDQRFMSLNFVSKEAAGLSGRASLRARKSLASANFDSRCVCSMSRTAVSDKSPMTCWSSFAWCSNSDAWARSEEVVAELPSGSESSA